MPKTMLAKMLILVLGESSGRIDHIDVLGDVVAGNFEVFAALSRSNQIIRWTLQNGNLTQTKVTTVTALYPSTAANFGTSPRIKALNSNEVLVHGSAIQPTKYNVETGAIIDSFEANYDLTKQGGASDGIDAFELCGKHFLLYSSGDYQTANAQVESVTYYNMMGVASNRPYPGINIVVKRMSDGTTTSSSFTASSFSAFSCLKPLFAYKNVSKACLPRS